MKQTLAGLALAWTASLAAQETPLSAAALVRCADQALTLRTESAQIQARLPQLEARRRELDGRAAALQAQARSDTGELRAGLSLYERRRQHNDEVLALNAQVERIRGEIHSLNAVRQEYHGRCANRPYRRADLNALPAAQREAMRAGLADVQVPYLDPTAPTVLPQR